MGARARQARPRPHRHLGAAPCPPEGNPPPRTLRLSQVAPGGLPPRLRQGRRHQGPRRRGGGDARGRARLQVGRGPVPGGTRPGGDDARRDMGRALPEPPPERGRVAGAARHPRPRHQGLHLRRVRRGHGLVPDARLLPGRRGVGLRPAAACHHGRLDAEDYGQPCAQLPARHRHGVRHPRPEEVQEEAGDGHQAGGADRQHLRGQARAEGRRQVAHQESQAPPPARRGRERAAGRGALLRRRLRRARPHPRGVGGLGRQARLGLRDGYRLRQEDLRRGRRARGACGLEGDVPPLDGRRVRPEDDRPGAARGGRLAGRARPDRVKRGRAAAASRYSSSPLRAT